MAKTTCITATERLIQAACFAADLDLLEVILSDPARITGEFDVIERKYWDRYGGQLRRCQTGGSSVVDRAVEGILVFNVVVKECSLSKSELSSIAAIQSGQPAILERALQVLSDMQRAASPLKFATQWARKHDLPMGPTIKLIEESVGAYLRDTSDAWRGPRVELFTHEFLALVLLNDDGGLFGEYLRTLDQHDELAKSSVLALTEEAVDLDAGNVVEAAVRWFCGSLTEDVLSRAVAAASPRAARALLPPLAGSSVWTLAEPAFAELVTKELAEHVVQTLELLAERPPSNRGRLQFLSEQPTTAAAAAKKVLPVARTAGVVEAAERARRRRVVKALRQLDAGGWRLGDRGLVGIAPAISGLGARLSVKELRAGAPDFTAPRLFVEECVAKAAAAGEAEVVAHLLTTAVSGDGPDFLSAVEVALKRAIEFDRTDVVEAVLGDVALTRLSNHDVLYIIGYMRDQCDLVTGSAVDRYLSSLFE